MLKFIEARLNIVACNRRCGCDDTVFDSLCGSAVGAITTHLARSSSYMSDVDVASAVEMVSTADFTSHHKKALVLALSSKSGDVAQLKESRQQLQNGESLIMFLMQSDWEALRSATSRAHQRELITLIAFRFGIVHPTEKTFAAMSVIILGPQWVAGPDGLIEVRDLKKIFRSIATRLQPKVGIAVLPSHPDDLNRDDPVMYNNVFPTEGPVDPPGGLASWTTARAVIPCRGTRSGCSQVQTQSPKANLMMSTLMDFMATACTRGSASHEIPLQFMQQQQQQRFAVPQPMLAGPRPMLALMPPQVESQDSSGSRDATPDVAQQPQPQHVVAADQFAPVGQTPPDAAAKNVEGADSVAKMIAAMQNKLKFGGLASGSTADLTKANADVAGTRKHTVPMKSIMKKPSAVASETAVKIEPGISAPAKKSVSVKAAKKPVTSTPSKAGVRKRPASASFLYGCTKCRMKPHGCAQCWDPDFSGKRRSA